ncbi:MAG TPA: Fpg/Nei family DNA glycosylase [Solirubrobacteraceae bacterium]|nr:Fpg/Nei family DNA glycosylase [Solirubrobacteraceae bacterium]
MPELPEVETIRRQLAPLVEGRMLARVEVLDPRWSRPLPPQELAAALAGRRVLELGRRGKYLLWRLSGELYLAQHLRMTGTVLADPDPEPPHTRVRIVLGPGRTLLPSEGDPHPPCGRTPCRAHAGGRTLAGTPWRAHPHGHKQASGQASAATHRLAIVDPRRFGTGELLAGSEAMEAFFAARLGLEPFDEGFTAAHLGAISRGRRAPIKALLLDQRRIAGVGNIYADEALFRAGIHPSRPAGRLSAPQRESLREAIVAALQAGIDARGATIDDFRHVDGVQGSFQDRFRVYQREGEPCVACCSPIVKTVVAGRGTYVCESCQPRPRRRAPA